MTQLVWLVTGCSSGLGLEFVHSILARGDLVIATARTLSSIEQLSKLGAELIAAQSLTPHCRCFAQATLGLTNCRTSMISLLLILLQASLADCQHLQNGIVLAWSGMINTVKYDAPEAV